MRKPVFGVSDQVPHKPGCTATEDGQRLEISDLGRRGIALCVFVFAYAKSRFSHDAAHLLPSKETRHSYRLKTFLYQRNSSQQIPETCFPLAKGFLVLAKYDVDLVLIGGFLYLLNLN